MRNTSFYILFIAIIAAACSSQSTTWTSKAFHNTTAHYNGFFYAKDEIQRIEKTILKSEPDDYNRILKLAPRLDSTLAKSYDKEIQEAIKMASLAIQRHPNSKWVDDSYILVGKARLYSMDMGNAVQTFKYVNTKSKDANTRHEALIHLAHTFIENNEYNNADAVFDYLSKEKLSKVNQKNYYLLKGFYYQLREDYNNMVQNLTLAAPMLTKKDRPGRIYFIMGQVYQRLGFEAEAFNFYRQCLSTNPDYEVDFYARLYMAQVAEISKSRDIQSARKSFKKLLKDSKNRDFRDKIYYELGVFESKQKNLKEAIENYNLAVRLGNSKLVDGQAFLRLGEIYYDTLKNYTLSQAYYDSAVAVLPTTFENYKAIVARQKILDEFVKNLNTITWQDSLLVLAKMDTASLRKHIASVLEKDKKPEVKSKRKKRERIDISTVNTSFTGISTETVESSNWYFGNPAAVVLGQAEFTRIWGSIPLEDNWRRVARTTTARQTTTAAVTTTTQTETKAVAVKSPVQQEFERITQELPQTDQQVKEALQKIEDAYFRLGDIYYFDLQEKNNAITSYQKLLSRFPESSYCAEALYKLYLLYKEDQPGRAEGYASLLKEKYPESSFAKILINPNYQKESGIVLEKQQALYKLAYENFNASKFDSAYQLVQQAVHTETTSFTPNIKLLEAMILGKIHGINAYEQALTQLIEKYPDSNINAYAKKLLETAQQLKQQQEKENTIQYSASLEQAHFFALVTPKDEKSALVLLQTMEKFNNANFKALNLKVSTITLNDSYSITLVADLTDANTAINYFKTFTEKLPSLIDLKSIKFDNFIITKENFDIFYRTKGLNEYLQFFENNYRSKNP